MKRIIFCFDGTWNRIDAEHPTNVLLMASSIIPQTDDGITQIVHYDNGVGTAARDKLTGGITGYGLFDNIEQAYQFLIFNYQPGDQVFAFGFSRGAFTARSFMGFIRTVGIIERHHSRHIKEAVELYKSNKAIDRLDLLDFRQKYSSHSSVCREDNDYRCKVDPNYISGQAYPFSVRYLGLWDTVETLGFYKVVWQHLPILGRKAYTGKDHRYHKHKLAGMLAGGRHAVALDERRRNFDVEPWGDVDHYNRKFGVSLDAPDKPCQEKFFPGVHGSVGGGGAYRGLSDGALAWIQEGASKAGLVFDSSASSSLYQMCPIFTDPLDNNHGHKKKGLKTFLMHARPRWRKLRPAKLADVSPSAQYRYAYVGELKEGKYDPETLDGVKPDLDRLDPVLPFERKYDSGFIKGVPQKAKAMYYTVQQGDSLSKIALKYLGDMKRYPEIFDANPGVIKDPDKIYIGQVLRIPLDDDFVDPAYDTPIT